MKLKQLYKNQAIKAKVSKIIFESDTKAGKAFDVVLLWAILASILVVSIESMNAVTGAWKTIFKVMEYVFTFFFTLEYLCRLWCARKPLRYALSVFGIIDLLSTLPLYLGWIFGSARYLMIIRTFRLIRVFRVFKLFSFLEEGDKLIQSLILSFRKILVFFLFVVLMTVTLGALMYMVEGDVPGSQFRDVPTSIYWAIVTMTTVGYGDIAPVTGIGRILSAIVMLLGYTIMAVPTGIVSAQFIHDRRVTKKRQPKCSECGCPLPDDAHFCPHCGKNIPIETWKEGDK